MDSLVSEQLQARMHAVINPMNWEENIDTK